MAQDNPTQLPQVLLLLPSQYFTALESKASHKFHFLKPWDSPLPQAQFLHSSSPRETPITAQLLQLLPSLKLLITISAGLDRVDLAACRARGVRIANSSPIFAADVADMAVGLFLDVMRKISVVGGKRVGIVGLGHIGLEVAKRLEAFDCKILYNSRKGKPYVSYPFYSDVCELAANSDVLVICCALTAQTHHMINKNEMVQCLVQGEIKGAGLDVFENEPEVPKELFGLDNTADCFTDLTDLAMANLEAFFSNKPLLSEVVNY
ncbi:glyoxylate/hydroxypyruvate reductase HPR3-like [Pyrus ussuriensis x Pyrus communis]|uniref:Glyoxylate/hydroxypyruvate reductase HPR3-like n=1 Tax=Pyrus ussuriensis x Pyrus communis TaxID=2448454 RepID=A0A5N5EYH7_9ROSA|nr:glyoxylate/hydroxypyruvate reductase HPR3-like [Pyrus ussuriensis x Pyrus communis]